MFDVVQVLPLLMSADVRDRESLLKMCSLFRLMQILERQINKNLAAIDALLGCPLFLFSKDILLGVASASSASVAVSDEAISALVPHQVIFFFVRLLFLLRDYAEGALPGMHEGVILFIHRGVILFIHEGVSAPQG
jgi:hypothetical protein